METRINNYAMPESGSQLLSYTGNAGLGNNAQIPAINPNANLDVINQTARDILFLNHENNINLYHQKVKDRDTTLDLIAKGQIASGNIDPNDRKYYDEAKQSAMDSFHDAMSKGGLLNNTDAYKDYLGKVANLKNVTDWAQHRELTFAQLEAEKRQQTIPDDIKLYDNHIQKERSKPFWQPIDVLQKAFSYDEDALSNEVRGNSVTDGQIGTASQNVNTTGTTTWDTTTNKNGVITQKQTTKTSPLRSGQISQPKGTKGAVFVTGTQINPDGSISEISYTPEKYWDLSAIQTNTDELSASNPNKNYAYRKFLNDYTSVLPVDQQLETLKAYNNRLAYYSTQRGIQPIGTNKDGSPKYDAQIKFYQDPVSGKVLIQESPESFFAKHSLAKVNGDYVEGPKRVFDKDIAAYKINKEKANTDAIYKMGMLANARNKTRGYLDNLHQQMKFRKDAAEQDNLLDELWTRNISQQPTLIKPEGDNRISLAPIQANNSLPIFTLDGKTPKQLIPIGAVPKYSTDSYDKNGDLKPSAKPLYFEGGHYDPEYIMNNEKSPLNKMVLSPYQVRDIYLNFKKTQGKNWNGSMDDFMKLAVKNNKFEYKLKGANGSTDRALSLAAQRLISNTGTKKGQTAVFNGSADQPPLDESIQESSNIDISTNPNQ